MYYLVGKNLGHSFSKKIHNLFGNDNYELYETNSIIDFVKTVDFKGINITIPFKSEIIPLIDKFDQISKLTNSVNTILKKDNKLYGYNTDYYGLKETFSYYNVEIKNKNILILGNGSVSKTVKKLLEDKGAKSIIKLCRTIRNTNEYLFSDYKKFLNYDVLINTTPVGMYPNNKNCSLLNLSEFKNINCVVDLIYNPFRTRLLLDAEALNIKAINGLYMLVMQAKKAHEIFNNISIPKNYANKIFKKIYQNYINLVYVGLPLSGKTKYAKTMGKYLDKKVVDIDSYIEKTANNSIQEIFKKYGEKHFRALEKSVVENIYKERNLAISTGGGLIESSENMMLLKQNGFVIFLNKDPVIISRKKIYNRPLLKDSNNIFPLAERRVPLYKYFSDVEIKIKKSTDFHVNEIKEKINEYLNR
ncbi:shikimate kinase [Candidatus Izemoplasma sp. B36]|uniref:shikimate kinase n=1 Tax=Candidatus Izemoplasma sp. B36 TaxID=3242468 RepID=UPI003557801F